MRIWMLLWGSIAFAGLVAQPSVAQLSQTTSKPAAKSVGASTQRHGPARSGTIGGPAKKAGGINGTNKAPSH